MSDLHRLAEAVGVATSWSGFWGDLVTVSDETLTAVLRALDMLRPDEDPADALERRRHTVAERLLAPTTVVRPHERRVDVRVPSGAEVMLTGEDGTVQPLPVIDGGTGVRLPTDVPLGYHQLEIREAGETISRAHLIAVPDRAPLPERGWGWMVQLYALRSAGSWGVGDIDDFRELLRWSAEQGADFVVCNPLHAAAPTLPQEPSPYYPSSRRHWNPSYLRIERIPEFATAAADVRTAITRLGASRRAENTADRIDRDAMWEAKRAALELLWQGEHTTAREQAFADFRVRRGEPLEQFALWCAAAEEHGTDWRSWPSELRHPSTAMQPTATQPGSGPAGRVDPDRVSFFAWLQFLTDEQLAASQAAAVHAGMRLGIIHDLAVGVNPQGADAWALQEHLGAGVTVGAPPDAFNQQGQDWAQPPLLPHKLSETGYTVFRDLVRGLLRHAGGVRIDHILGFFRQFWVPQAGGPQAGTYVQFPARDLLGILALEATRAGAVIVGEDLGVVAQGLREALHEHHMLRSQLLYFAVDDHDRRLPPDGYERLAMASITTHDLPTAAGWWSDEDVRVQADLDLFAEAFTPEGEYERKRAERRSMEELLLAGGLLPGMSRTLAPSDSRAKAHPTPGRALPDPIQDADRVVAMHAFLGRCASLLVAANLPDAVGDIRQPNMPGTIDAYPNWRLPVATVAEGKPRPITFEGVRAHPQVRLVIDALSATRGRSSTI